MNSKNLIIALLTAAVLLLSLTLYFLNENIKTENSKRQLSGHIATLSVKEFSFDLNKTMTGRKATDVVCITRDDDEKYLSELINEKPVLIYRYTQAGCLPCYKEQIRLLQKVFQDTPERVAILSSYSERLSFLISVRDRSLGLPIYRISFDAFDWQLEEIGIPYFFVLHPCLRISNIFVPNKHKPELTIRYLESIKRLLQ